MAQKKRSFLRLLLVGTILLMGGLTVSAKDSQAASLKIKMNGKTSYYRGKQSTVTYKNKKITKTNFKGLTIKSTRMASYKDVFKKGLKVKTKYSSSSKKITFTKNGTKVVLKIGSKYATVNGVRKKMSAAPVKVRYVKRKKTKILVPVKFLCKQLGFYYKASGSEIFLSEAFVYEYNGKTGKSPIKSNLSFDGKENKLSTMPAFKIGSIIYVPAEEVFKKIIGLEYNYSEETGVLTLKNEATAVEMNLTLNEKEVQVNGTSRSIIKPMYEVTRKDKNKTVLCVPVKAVSTILGYYYKWDSAKPLVNIHDLVYFNWKATDPAISSSDPSQNNITEMGATYNPSIDCISFSIKGSNVDLMNTATVVRNEKVVTVTIPAASKYCLENYNFNKFVTTLEKIEVVEDGSGNVVIHITGFNPVDFAYTSLDGVLTLNIMGEYVGNYALKIAKPSGTSIADVSNQDLYNSKKFKITLRGDHINFLNENPIAISKDVITDVSADLDYNSNTVITVTTSKLQGYKIYEKSDSFVVAVDNPRNIYRNIVVLDAGHGGNDAGASNKGTKEKDLNLKIIYTLMKDYFNSNAPDTKVYWTRTTDKFITLADRAAFPSKVGADLFVSLHMNSAPNSSANGTEVYYSTNNNSKSFSGITSKTVATLFKNNLVAKLGTNSRGVKTAGYYVTKHNTVPAVLIELGFLSGNSDYSRLTDPTFQENSAKVIYDTINQIFTNYPTGRK